MTVPFGLHRARVGRDHTRSVLNGKQITAVLPAYNAGVGKDGREPGHVDLAELYRPGAV